jgi:peptidoglycan DL-endopeptidase CwlO
MGSRRRLIATLPLALALGIAGCGGGGDSGTTTAATTETTAPPALSKEELIAQGDAICAEVNAAVGTVSASSTEGSSQIAQEANLYSGMVERIKDLGTPEDSSGYSEFIAAADELSQAESDAQLASERGDESGLAVAQEEASSALASFQSAAGTYGFEDCSEGPSAPVAPTTSAPSSEEAVPSEGVEAEAEVEEEAAPEAEPAPETGGAGGTVEAAPPSGGGTSGGGGGTSGGSSGGIGPG